MRKDEAIIILTKKLVEEGHVYFVESKRSQDFYERTAKFFQPITLENQMMRIEKESDAISEKSYDESGCLDIRPKYLNEEAVEDVEVKPDVTNKSVTKKIRDSDWDWDEIKKRRQFHAINVNLEHIIAEYSHLGANYFFIEECDLKEVSNESKRLRCRILAFPYAIITEKEIEQLKYWYLGELPEEISKAAKVLNLEKELKANYAELAKADTKKFVEHFHLLPKERKVAIIEEMWDVLQKESWGKDFHKELLMSYDELVTEAGRNRIEKKMGEDKK